MPNYRYSNGYSHALISNGRRVGTYDWSSDERRDFIGMWRMGGEL